MSNFYQYSAERIRRAMILKCKFCDSVLVRKGVPCGVCHRRRQKLLVTLIVFSGVDVDAAIAESVKQFPLL